MNFRRMMLTNKEFFRQACRWKDSKSIQTAAEWWSAFQEVIIREIFYNGTCRIPGLGRFGIEEREGGYQKQKDEKGREVTYFIPARIVPVFVPEDDFINDVNMQGVTKAYRSRLKAGELTQRDFEREIRAESMNGEIMMEDMMRQRKQKARKELSKLLDEKHKTREEAIAKRNTYSTDARAVVQMDEDYNVIAMFKSMTDAQKITGIDKTHISCACSGKYGRKRAAGYRWRYATEEEKEEIGNDKFNESETCDTEP